MKAAIFEKTGQPNEVVAYVDVPNEAPAAGEVRVKVKAANINPSDIMFIRGMYGITAQLPSSAGFEAAGVIDAVGEGVSLPIGMEVIFSNIGVWKEYVVTKAKGIIPKPKQMSFEFACQAFVNPFTAYGMLEVSGLKSGDWLLITAGASAYGKLVIQMAAKKGIKTIATVRREEQKEMLMAIGATHVINTEMEKMPKAVLELTDGKGAKAVFDAVGGALGARALASLATGGTMYVFGLLSLENLPLNSGLMIFKDLTIKGFWLTTFLESLGKEEREKAFTEVLGGLASSNLKLDIEATYPLSKIKDALAHYEQAGRTGKIILTE